MVVPQIGVAVRRSGVVRITHFVDRNPIAAAVAIASFRSDPADCQFVARCNDRRGGSHGKDPEQVSAALQVSLITVWIDDADPHQPRGMRRCHSGDGGWCALGDSNRDITGHERCAGSESEAGDTDDHATVRRAGVRSHAQNANRRQRRG